MLWNETEPTALYLFAINSSLKTEFLDKKEQLLCLMSGERILFMPVLFERGAISGFGRRHRLTDEHLPWFYARALNPVGYVRSHGLDLNRKENNVTVRFCSAIWIGHRLCIKSFTNSLSCWTLLKCSTLSMAYDTAWEHPTSFPITEQSVQ